VSDLDARIRERIAAAFGDDLAALQYRMTPRAMRFPQGFRYRYFRAPKRGRAREWWCAWSTTRNENGKFISFVYEWQGDEAGATRLREHAKRKDAKARALRFSEQRKAGAR